MYIFPAEASYVERNFELRISTAKVEVEESTFTALPGVQRKLMILEGEITVNHDGQYSKHLKPFEVDTFSGDWNSRAIGTCTDFNVMTRSAIQSELYHVEIGANSIYQLKPKTNCNNLFLYPTSGNILIELNGEKHNLPAGNLLVIEDFDNSTIELNCKESCSFAVVELYQS